jgi:formamidopyrimidine-DNA glycosylase
LPEGPEVKIIGESLAKWASSKRVTEINVLSGRYLKKPMPGLEYARSNTPLDIVGVGVHGKFIYWISRNDIFLYNTLGMTGEWSKEKSKHTRVEVKFEDDVVYFNDQRNFGTLKFVEGRSNLIQKLKSLGPDLLSEEVSDQKFIDRLRTKNKWEVTKAMMDQSVVAGIGNYVKAEALWRSRISPHRTVESIRDPELAILNRACQEVLITSYSQGGASIKNYRRPDGSLGQYTSRFAVYNQKEDPDGNPVVKESTGDGRTTHWVPSVQI